MREFYTLSLSIAYCLVASEDGADESVLKKFDYIKENTHSKILLPLTTTELIILTNLGRGISKTIEFRNNQGVIKEYTLHELIRYAKESYFELAKEVTKIAKKYSLDIPMRQSQGVFELPTAPNLISMEAERPA